MEWWVLPGPRRFVRRIVDDLQKHRSVIVRLPSTLDVRSFREFLVRATESLAWERVSIAQLDAREPAAALASHFRIGSCNGPADLAHAPALGGYAIWLDDWGLLAPDGKARWAAFMSAYAHAARNVAPAKPCVCVVPILGADPGADTIATDVMLAVHWWWGVVSRLDMSLHVSQIASRRRDVEPMREAISARLAGFDPQLAERLDEVHGMQVRDLAEVIRSYRVTHTNFEALPPKSLASRLVADSVAALCPKASWRAAWGAGFVDQIRGGAIERHIASYADARLETVIGREVWRAQAGELMPWLDERRLAVVEHLKARFGARWFGEPGHTPEFGELKLLFDRDRTARASMRPVYEFVFAAHAARNNLAHLQHLSHFEIEKLQALFRAAFQGIDGLAG